MSKSSTACVLVTDGEHRAALAAVRSLGRAGHRVFVCARYRRSIAGASRHSRGQAMLSATRCAPEQFVREVATLVRKWGIDIVIPISDASLEALLPRREQVPALIPFPVAESYRGLSDKRQVLEVARGLGIAVPSQRLVECRAELEPAAAALRFPLVLKASRSVRSREGGASQLAVRHAMDSEDLAALAKELSDDMFPLLLQERIVGQGIGVFLLTWDERTLAVFSHRRLREKPPSGGESVYAESTALDPELVERCEELVRRFGWRGALMVELKVDERTGIPYLMEVNARLWGTLQLAVDCGVDFPALLVAAALGAAEPPVRAFRIGARLRWWWGDVDHLVTRLIRSRRRLSLPPTTPGRLAALQTFLATTLRGEADAVFRRDDARPFVVETIDWLRRR
jgi:predicted ATP-grasp superfamily ATP-dependent carboligase